MTWSGSAFLGGVLSDARDYRFPGAQRGKGFWQVELRTLHTRSDQDS